MTSPSTDLAALTQLITLPRAPRAVLWQRAVRGTPGLGPTDWSLIALVELAPEDARALVATATVTRKAPPPPDAPWLPEPVRAGLKNARALDPAPFVRGPLLHGNAYYLEASGHILVHLFTT